MQINRILFQDAWLCNASTSNPNSIKSCFSLHYTDNPNLASSYFLMYKRFMILVCKYWITTQCKPQKVNALAMQHCNTKHAQSHTHAHTCTFTFAFMCLFFEVATREQKPHFIHSRPAGNTKHTHTHTLYTHLSRATGHQALNMSKVLS